MNSNTLIVISVPFGRNARFLLSSKIYERIKNEYKVLLVSPFSNRENFVKEFGGHNVSFLFFNPEISFSQINFIARKAYAISEALRRNGYWFRFRNRRMRYYWNLLVGNNGNINGNTIKSKLKGYVLGWIGYFRCSWKLIDRIGGDLLYDAKSILKHTEGYKNVIIIQTATWGYQERFLSYCAHKYSYKTVFVPYTTDQLLTNGYLLSDFDKICTQGPIETKAAQSYHKIPLKRIAPLGMLWFRNIEEIFSAKQRKQNNKEKKRKIILYAGNSSTYFPRLSELNAIDTILYAIKTNILPNSRVIYRPVPKDSGESEIIYNRYKNEDSIEIQIPQLACYGMLDYPSTMVKNEISDYLENLSSIDVFVMSLMTTMCFDALYFNKPVISNFTDPSLIMKKRGTRAYLEDDITGMVSSGIPIVFTHDDFIQKIKEALNNPSWHTQVRENILSNWDYQNQNYVTDFMELIKELTH